MASENEARQILPGVEASLTALPNVVGIGVVLADESTHEAAIAVYVRRKLPLEVLQAGQVVPETVESTVNGVVVRVPTRVIEVGDFKL
ncbi:hypothetical protein [Microvirgula aerodenitrificans]|uniref:Uncharacterized protein n=1 Tax=Microvirgula aerodenitrificans TaxID=57480 RepID=A0A2S0PEJ5_9NEIS|nr:hypothetical protein [Microvirgula aerodenitrificans]AVY95804.1 hypothetical protein DAI18_18465 [Microvirgula aerodenitrificans]